MSNGYIIEINDRDAGLLVREGDGYAFMAIADAFASLDGRRFANVSEAERAALKLVRRRQLDHQPT